MFGKRLTLFRLFGFAVQVDLSWLLIAVLVTWSLATGLFPQRYPDVSQVGYWLMGTLGALGLFASIIFHEFWHSLVARRYGLQIRGITLFVFGGVSEMSEEPETPKTEFLMAVAGPISSIVLAMFCYLIYLWGKHGGWTEMLTGVVGYLAFINGLLAVFNLVPAFPLDGGRILRSALWKWRNNLRWATHKAAGFGSGFGIFLVILGLFNIYIGNLIGGMWYFVIGLFLRNAALMSYREVLFRQTFEGEPVSKIMSREPVTVSASITVRELVEDYVYLHHFKTFPVLENEKLSGCVTIHRIKEITKEEWGTHSVREITSPCTEENTIGPDTDVLQALSVMKRTGNSRLMVVDGGQLVGIISIKDILGKFAARMELEEM